MGWLIDRRGTRAGLAAGDAVVVHRRHAAQRRARLRRPCCFSLLARNRRGRSGAWLHARNLRMVPAARAVVCHRAVRQRYDRRSARVGADHCPHDAQVRMADGVCCDGRQRARVARGMALALRRARAPFANRSGRAPDDRGRAGPPVRTNARVDVRAPSSSEAVGESSPAARSWIRSGGSTSSGCRVT